MAELPIVNLIEPLVSVVIPTYNRQAIIAAAVQSALDQTYRNIEVIVVDDGSTDNTAQVLDQFGGRIRLVRQENAGPSAARNRGVSVARGDILAFLDSDDTWAPTKLARQVHLLQRLGPQIPCCLCNVSFGSAGGAAGTSFAVAGLRPELEEGVWENVTEVLLSRFVLFNQALVVRQSALLKAGLFRPDLRLLEDYDLALRLSLLGPWAFIAEPLVNYGTGQANSLTGSSSRDRTVVPKTVCKVLDGFAGLNLAKPERIAAKLRRQIVLAKLRLRIAHLRSSKNPASKCSGAFMDIMLRYFQAILRRSPFFPRMRVISAGGFLESPGFAFNDGRS